MIEQISNLYGFRILTISSGSVGVLKTLLASPEGFRVLIALADALFDGSLCCHQGN